MKKLIKLILFALKRIRPINYIRFVLYNILIIGYTIVHSDLILYIYKTYLNLTYLKAITNNLYWNLLNIISYIIAKVIPVNLFKTYALQYTVDGHNSLDVYKFIYITITKVLSEKLESLKLTIIWGIKRSNNCLLKFIKNFLNKYTWFQTNIIKFP